MDLDEAVTTLAAKQQGVIHRKQAHKKGMSDKQILVRVQSGRWLRLHPSVFLIRPAPITVAARAMAAVLAIGGGAVVVGATAAHLLGLLEQAPDGPIEILSRHRARIRGVKVYIDPDLPLKPRVFTQGIPIGQLQSIVFFAAKCLSERELGTLIDRARRLGMKMHRLETLLERKGGSGTNGTRNLRKQIALRTGNGLNDSDLEDLFLPHVLRRKLDPQLQFTICENGRYMRRGDFVFPEIKVDGETDGYDFHGRYEQWQKDRDIDKQLMLCGWLVPRFTYWDVVERPAEAADQLAEIVRARRRNPPI